MAVYYFDDSKDAQANQLLVGIPLLIVAFFCFSFVLMHASSHKASHANSSSPSAANKQTNSSPRALPFTKMPKLDLAPVQASPDSSQITSAPPVQSSVRATQALQAAPPTQSSSDSTSLLGHPVKLLPKIKLDTATDLLDN